MPNKKQAELQETPEYHNTYLLLKKYRDVVWNLELSVQRVKNKFRIEISPHPDLPNTQKALRKADKCCGL